MSKACARRAGTLDAHRFLLSSGRGSLTGSLSLHIVTFGVKGRW